MTKRHRLRLIDALPSSDLLSRRKLEKLRKKLKASQKEVQDIQSEFQVERDDFLDTIRGAERELKLFTAIAKRYSNVTLELSTLIPCIVLKFF